MTSPVLYMAPVFRAGVHQVPVEVEAEVARYVDILRYLVLVAHLAQISSSGTPHTAQYNVNL